MTSRSSYWLFCITITSTFAGLFANRAEVWMFETTYACENDNMHLSCESSNVLEIQRALYRGATESICREDKDSVRTCAEFDRTEVLKLRCDNQTQCHILVLTRTFDDPCPALRKFLNVVYACVEPMHNNTVATTTPSPTSKIATNQGITTNYSTWMNHSATANISQLSTTESTQRTKTQRNLKRTNQPEKGGPKKAIPVFDPSNSVMLESISNSAQAMKVVGVGFLSLASVFGLVAVWRM